MKIYKLLVFNSMTVSGPMEVPLITMALNQ